MADARLGPPVPDPQKILCIGLNYRAHANEAALDEPTVPMVFAKFPNVLIGAGAPIELPEGHGEKVDYEGEIAVVIGRRAYRRSEEDALDVVAGWMPFNDVSARDVQTQTSQWTVGKSPDTFGPCGPYLVLDDAMRDGGLEIETQVNGERVQHARSDRMIFSVARADRLPDDVHHARARRHHRDRHARGRRRPSRPAALPARRRRRRGARQRRAPLQPGPPPGIGGPAERSACRNRRADSQLSRLEGDETVVDVNSSDGDADRRERHAGDRTYDERARTPLACNAGAAWSRSRWHPPRALRAWACSPSRPARVRRSS